MNYDDWKTQTPDYYENETDDDNFESDDLNECLQHYLNYDELKPLKECIDNTDIKMHNAMVALKVLIKNATDEKTKKDLQFIYNLLD